jgi:hypothetical protein
MFPDDAVNFPSCFRKANDNSLGILEDMLTQPRHDFVAARLHLEVLKPCKMFVELGFVDCRSERHWHGLAGHPLIKTALNLQVGRQ